MSPKLLDLFCGLGGAGVGYHQAGFEVVGVDITPQPHYPFTFIQGDALHPPVDLHAFDLIHASPPCQGYTGLANRWGSTTPRLIPAVKSLLDGHRYVIENVVGAQGDMTNPVKLTGEMFSLTVFRPRLFDVGGWWMLTPAQPRRQTNPVAIYGQPNGRRLWDRRDGSTHRAWSSVAEGQAALGIDWSDDPKGLREAIPPAYTRYIGEMFMAQMG